METGIQVSSVKPLLLTAEQVDAAFGRMAELGCGTVQLQWIDPSVPIGDIAGALDRHGLRSVSVQDFYRCVSQRPEYYIGLNAATGGTWLCPSRIPEEYRSLPGLGEFAGELRALAARLAPLGQRLCFHPVAADFVPVDGVDPVEYLLSAVPEMEICFDLYHLHKAGFHMPTMLRRYAGRVCMVHFKEGRKNSDGTESLVPAGQGDICWDGVVEACLETGVPYAFVEQERWEKDPYECLGEALTWLRRRGDSRG